VIQKSDILIVGCDSTIGGALSREATSRELNWNGTSRRPTSNNFLRLDLANAEEVGNFSASADTVYFCAAVTSQQLCATEYEFTRNVNVNAICKLAEALSEREAHLIFLSTSSVFNGNASFVPVSRETCPQTEYGKQKADAEKRLLRLNNVSIVRLTKVVHSEIALFKRWRDELCLGKIINPLSDLYFSPIPLSLVVSELLELHQNFRPQIYHLSGNKDISYAEAGFMLANSVARSSEFVKPKTCAEAGISSGCAFTTLQYKSPSGISKAPEVRETMSDLFRTVKTITPC
jgi:dTDP-4-dehydrorhamnose reductase